MISHVDSKEMFSLFKIIFLLLIYLLKVDFIYTVNMKIISNQKETEEMKIVSRSKNFLSNKTYKSVNILLSFSPWHFQPCYRLHCRRMRIAIPNPNNHLSATNFFFVFVFLFLLNFFFFFFAVIKISFFFRHCFVSIVFFFFYFY